MEMLQGRFKAASRHAGQTAGKKSKRSGGVGPGPQMTNKPLPSARYTVSVQAREHLGVRLASGCFALPPKTTSSARHANPSCNAADRPWQPQAMSRVPVKDGIMGPVQQ